MLFESFFINLFALFFSRTIFASLLEKARFYKGLGRLAQLRKIFKYFSRVHENLQNQRFLVFGIGSELPDCTKIISSLFDIKGD
jgi:hypothetical protein